MTIISNSSDHLYLNKERTSLQNKLIKAAKNEDTARMWELIDVGASLFARNREGLNALDYLMCINEKKGKEFCVKYFKDDEDS